MQKQVDVFLWCLFWHTLSFLVLLPAMITLFLLFLQDLILLFKWSFFGQNLRHHSYRHFKLPPESTPTSSMGSYKNMKNPANVDRPPLFNSAYRGAVLADSWDGYKSFNFNAQRPVEREIYATVGNSLTKIPKVETEMCFSSDSGELPSLKRPKYDGDVTFQHLQVGYVYFFLSFCCMNY